MSSFFSSGKIILSGEHAVVYGYPALVFPSSQYVSVSIHEGKKGKLTPFLFNVLSIFQQKYKVYFEDIEISIESTLPVGSGLGSSAAVAAAVFQALYNFFSIQYTKEDLLFLVQESEKFAHGNPSGVDAVAVVYQDVIEFQKKENKLQWKILEKGKNIFPPFLLLQSGVPNESTKEMVEYVRNFQGKDVLLEEIGKVTTKIAKKLKDEQIDVELITQNERLLEKLGVVGEKAKEMIHQIEACGGTAKIVGAGGRKKGSGIIIAFHQELDVLKNLALQNNWEMI